MASAVFSSNCAVEAPDRLLGVSDRQPRPCRRWVAHQVEVLGSSAECHRTHCPLIGRDSARGRLGRVEVKRKGSLVKESRGCLAPRVPESRNSLAIVLRWRAYGESDKIATFLTEDFGKLTGIAKGAKNSRRRFANSLEPLARVRVHFRQNADRESRLSGELRAAQQHRGVQRSDPLRLRELLVELADQLTLEDDPVPGFYALLDEALAELERGPATTRFPARLRAAAADAGPASSRSSTAAPAASGSGPGTTRAHLSFSHGTVTCTACRGVEEVGDARRPGRSLRGWRSSRRCRSPPAASELTTRWRAMPVRSPAVCWRSTSRAHCARSN